MSSGEWVANIARCWAGSEASAIGRGAPTPRSIVTVCHCHGRPARLFVLKLALPTECSTGCAQNSLDKKRRGGRLKTYMETSNLAHNQWQTLLEDLFCYCLGSLVLKSNDA